jgi:hypothetical protein
MLIPITMVQENLTIHSQESLAVILSSTITNIKVNSDIIVPIIKFCFQNINIRPERNKYSYQ